METPLRRIRKAKNLTLAELGRMTGLTHSALSKFETRKKNPRIETLKVIAECLGVDWRDLVED